MKTLINTYCNFFSSWNTEQGYNCVNLNDEDIN